jgi:hypothetical protein
MAKLLREMYLAGDDPLVVVDAADDKENLDRTVAITSTDTLPPTEHTRSTRPEHETQLLDGVVRAERSRLEWARWRARLKVFMAVLTVATLLGAVAFAAKKFLPDLLRRAPPAAPAPMQTIMKNQEMPVPGAKAKGTSPGPAKPAIKKHPGRVKGKGHAPAGAEEAAPTSPDAPLPPTPE